jgi:predicted nucleotidyltransferase
MRGELAAPEEVGQGLERFCGELREALGEQLQAVILYGGLARGEYSPESSDVNVMVVLDQAGVETLDRIAGAVHRGVRDFGLAVMVLTEEDLRRSTDVFPTKFLDIQRHHRVLWGRDVLAGLEISKEHLRLRCEQEIKNLLLRLRQFYVQRAHHPELIESTLTHAASSFFSDLGVLLLLKSGAAPATRGAIMEAAVRELGLDEATLKALLALKAGEYRPDLDGLKALYGGLMDSVHQAADLVDRL